MQQTLSISFKRINQPGQQLSFCGTQPQPLQPGLLLRVQSALRSIHGQVQLVSILSYPAQVR